METNRRIEISPRRSLAFLRLGRSQIAVVTLLGAVGCGGPGSSSSAPVESEVRSLVAEALDAWKAGSAADALARRSPPLRFVDPDLASGMKLVQFTIGEPGKAYEYVCDIPVELTLRDRRGRAVSRRAVYQVATQPGPSVLRNDPD